MLAEEQQEPVEHEKEEEPKAATYVRTRSLAPQGPISGCLRHYVCRIHRTVASVSRVSVF